MSATFTFHVIVETSQGEINCHSTEFESILDAYGDFQSAYPSLCTLMSLMPEGNDLVEHVRTQKPHAAISLSENILND